MSLRITNMLLLALIVMIGIFALLQVQSNKRQQVLLESLLREAGYRAPRLAAGHGTPADPVTSPVDRASVDSTQTAPDQTQRRPADATTDSPDAAPALDVDPSSDTRRADGPARGSADPPADDPAAAESNQRPSTGATAVVSLAASPLPDDATWQKLESIYVQIIMNLLDGAYEPVVQRFDATMAAVLSPDKLAEVMDQIRRTSGPFDTILATGRVRFGVPENQTCYQVQVRTKRDEVLVFTITLDQARRISGLFVREAGDAG